MAKRYQNYVLHKQMWYFYCRDHMKSVKLSSFPTALSIHQLAAQGEVSQVAAHLSKGEESASCSLLQKIIAQCHFLK